MFYGPLVNFSSRQGAPGELISQKCDLPPKINWKGDKKLFEPELNAIAERVSTNTIILT